MQSIEKYAHIPQTFDGELPSSAFSDGKVTRMLIGQTYITPGPDGIEVPAQLTTATVSMSNREMILAFHDPRTDKAWITKAPMSQAELDDYSLFPETFFGIHLQQGKELRTPLELFDFMHKSYKNTPKEKLLELMAKAPDFDKLKHYTQAELSEIFCERSVNSIIAAQRKEPSPCEEDLGSGMSIDL